MGASAHKDNQSISSITIVLIQSIDVGIGHDKKYEADWDEVCM